LERRDILFYSLGNMVGLEPFGGGFLNQTHRRAHIALDLLEQKEGALSAIRSLEVMESLFDFCGLRCRLSPS